MELDELLRTLTERGGSDLYLTADSPPLVKVDGVVHPVTEESFDGDEVETIIWRALVEKERAEFERTSELSAARVLPDLGRFRLSVFRQRGQIGLVARLIRTDIPTVAELGLPASLLDLVMHKRGLIVVTGATGSGKSTTLAAMLDHRNVNTKGHILTVEDPIEFIHPHKGCVVTQREVGADTETFAAALKSALRQAPDVILIGEMRDLETVESALHFAETGHLVLGTLHATNADQAIERILNFFATDMHKHIHVQLSLNLRGIISQRLVPRADGQGRTAAVEVMLNSPRIASLISKGETTSLKSAIEANAMDGSQSFDQALFQHYESGIITVEEALRQADSANNLKLKIKMAEGGERPEGKAQFSIKSQDNPLAA
jgi:twitching motility protein PilU